MSFISKLFMEEEVKMPVEGEVTAPVVAAEVVAPIEPVVTPEVVAPVAEVVETVEPVVTPEVVETVNSGSAAQGNTDVGVVIS